MKMDWCTRLGETRAPFNFYYLTLSGSGGDVDKVSIRAKTSIERGVNATDHRCELWLPMASWGRMPLPPTHTCPQEPWEAQE